MGKDGIQYMKSAEISFLFLYINHGIICKRISIKEET